MCSYVFVLPSTCGSAKPDFDINDYLGSKPCSRLHKILLGIVDAGLGTQLILSTSDIDAVDHRGMTALTWAAIRGDMSSTRLLLTYGADPNIAALNGDTPLIWTARAPNPACLKPLIEFDADLNARDMWKATALMNSVGVRDDVRYLQPLIEAKTDLELEDKYGRTTLVRAVALNRVNAVRFLLQNGARFAFPDIVPLAIAIGRDHAELAEILLMHTATKMSKEQIAFVVQVARDKSNDMVMS